MTTLATTREAELADALAAVRSTHARAAEAAGRNVDEMNYCRSRNSFRRPMY